jgi:predicted metal-binding protein
MAQTQAKLMKEKQANEKVSVVHCTSCHQAWATSREVDNNTWLFARWGK